MAESSSGPIISKISTMTPAEYVDAILETGTSIEVIEDFVVRKIADIKSEIDALPVEKKEELLAKEKELAKFESILKEIKKQLVKNATEQSLKENIEKTKKCYEETLALGEEAIKYIEGISLDEYFDVTSTNRNLSEKNAKFKNHISIQLDLNKKSAEYLNSLKDEAPEMYEQYKDKLPVFEGKSYDYIKEKYKLIVLKIKELEEKDKDNNELLIEELYNTINNVLPCMLTDSKDMDKIKSEVAVDLGIKQPEPEMGDGAEEKEPEKKTIPPLTGQEDPNFIAAKKEYLSLITSINNQVLELELINDQQDALASDPEFNMERIVETEKQAVTINKRITGYKNTLSDIEYDNYIKHHILLNLDPEIAEAKINTPSYYSVLDEFMNTHNAVIEYAYRRMFAISKIGKEKECAIEIDNLLKLIDAEHLIINRRLVSERQQDKKFDIIGYMRAHKVDIKAIKAEVEMMDLGEEIKDDLATIKSLESKIEKYKADLEVLVKIKYQLEIKIDDPDTLAKEVNDNEQNLYAITKGLEDEINNAKISEEAKNELLEKLGQAQDEVRDSFNAITHKDVVYHKLRVSFKEKFMELMEFSQELIMLSETSFGSEEYITKRDAFLEMAKNIQKKFPELGAKLTKNPNTNKVTFTIFNNIEQTETIRYSLSVMTPDLEKQLSRRVTTKVKPANLNFNGKTQNVDRQKALIETTDNIKLSVLKNSIKVQYTKTMLDDLKALKVKLEIAASAENEVPIAVTSGKESKDGTKEYRYIKDPDKLSEAKLIYRDAETGEEIMSSDLLQDDEIKKALEERKAMGR